ncbi:MULTISPECIES: ECF transporter S component [Staphylococcus]|uniref:ECF transporter S component n=1 Tax=Staphylococcus TaxID=1279 RepID=UPI0002462DCA|nr:MULTISPECIES: ECF transporter S component [Staphylococcus]QAV31451.1 thiamine ABC transporter permease [Sulfitobacter donghicola]AGZ26429.1 putative cobalt ABC transporter, permease protein [Staphylococcus pasteuri SP1]KAB7647073.1 thiamine ABC transporter permease [Staphylococcus sp. B2-b]MBN6852084.1 ECF transporter S component [Staphylococcus warneri]MBT2769063.1 ECF transporter S component [Staphylococcus warneri]
MSKGLKLSEILVTVLISVIFAIIYNLWWLFYNVAQVAGLHLEQLTYGVWFMAAIVCYLIIPKPGIALLAEFAAGAGETIVMGKFDIPTIIYALLQGLACEIIFAIFKYQSRSVMVAMLAGLVTALVSFPVDYFYGYLNEVAGWNLILFIVFRAISGIIIAGLLSYLLVKALDQTGVTKVFRPASKDDYDTL